ncbi:hypothetical protein ACMFMG_002393 [Clarireedia jacksonii]
MAPTKALTNSVADKIQNLQSENYQDEEASKDSKFKAIWDEQIGAKNTSVTYREAHVLLLSWHPDDDDLHVEQEVRELEDVFRGTFRYTTTRKILKQNPNRPPQSQIKYYLAEFVFEHDNPNNLLIVYYAGHGKLGDNGGGLNLTGATTRPDENKDLHEIVWNSAEHNIQDTQGDVLVIFDCCNAGEMDRNVRGSAFTRRAFEYMAATSHNSTTKKPGLHSFTAALIWALKEMVRCKPGKKFSTQELLLKIFNAPNFPKDQSPRLSERCSTGCLRKIVLAPMDNEHELAYETEDSPQSLQITRDTLNLGFVFDRVIKTKMVKDLAKDVSNLISQGDLGISTVLWEGINSAEPMRSELTDSELRALEFAINWRNRVRRRRGSSHSGIDRPYLSPILPRIATSTTTLMPHDSSMSPEESMVSTPNPEQLPLSPAPVVGTDNDATSPIDDTPQKRKHDNGKLHESESIDATSNLLPLPRKRRKTLRFDDQDPSSQPR